MMGSNQCQESEKMKWNNDPGSWVLILHRWAKYFANNFRWGNSLNYAWILLMYNVTIYKIVYQLPKLSCLHLSLTAKK